MRQDSRTLQPRGASLTAGTIGAALALTWGTIAVIGGTTAHLATGAGPFGKWASLMVPMLIYYGLWLMASIAVIFLARRRNRSIIDVGITIALHVSLLLAMMLSTPFLVASENWRTWLYGEQAIAFHGLTAAIYIFCALVAYGLKIYLEAQAAEKKMRAAAHRELELQKSLALTRHDALRMQMNPHFVFNTLNSVAALVHSSNPDVAYRAVELLGDVLRGILDLADTRLIALGTELELVRSYVELEQIRFGGRLALVENVEARLEGCSVPPLLLQPLVENVVKHVVSTTHDPVLITIAAELTSESCLLLSVSDNGPGMHSGDCGSPGIGLANTRSRLKLLFGPRASLTISNVDGIGCRVEIALPATFDAAAKHSASFSARDLSDHVAAENLLEATAQP